MRMTTRYAALCGLAVLLVTPTALAEVPGTMSYSGYLEQSDGAFDGMVEVEVALYDDDAEGDLIWDEDHGDVDVVAGWLNFDLGSIDEFDFDFGVESELWLEVTINGDAMLPRQRVNSAAFAFVAANATGALADDIAAVEGRLDALEGEDAVTWATISGKPTWIDAVGSGLATDFADGQIDWANIKGGPSGAEVTLSNITDLHADLISDLTAGEIEWANIDTPADGIPWASIDTPDQLTDGVVTLADAGLHADLVTDFTDGEVNWGELGGIPEDIASFAGENFLRHVPDLGMVFEGVNVHLRNGQGQTYGNDSDDIFEGGTPNGVGNLIIGYNEEWDGFDAELDREGSHNLVIGPMHQYMSFGSIVSGRANAVTGLYSAAIGGAANSASGTHAAVLGGGLNSANGPYTNVTGGTDNWAACYGDSVTGGHGNVAGSADFTRDEDGFPVGVACNLAEETGSWATVSGGRFNVASGQVSTVSGGFAGISTALASSVAGGSNNSASGEASSVTGGLGNIASGDTATVTSGAGNTASGEVASVTGGVNNFASCYGDSVTAGRWNVAGSADITRDEDDYPTAAVCNLSDEVASFATVSGGVLNIAQGPTSAISGGFAGNTQGPLSTIAGGTNNVTYTEGASIGGGDNVEGDNEWQFFAEGFVYDP